VQNNDLRSTGILYPAAGTGSLRRDLSGLSLDRGKVPMAHSDTPPSSSIPLPPEEPTLAEWSPVTAPVPCLFGLTNTAASYATALIPIYRRHVLDPIATTPIHTYSDSSEEDEAWVGADFSALRDPEAMHHFVVASDYCFSYSDSDDEGTYDPARECFHVGLGMPSTGDEDEGVGNRTPLRQGVGDATPSRVVPPVAWNESLVLEQL